MKKMITIIAILVGFAILMLIYIYNKKNYISYELFFEVANEKTEFYPMAYVFYSDYNDMLAHFKMIGKSERIKNQDFNFDKYSYVVVYGRKISGMYYSWKSSLVDDISPSYGKAKGTIFVVITYEDLCLNPTDEGGIYFYRIKKDPRLRGFNGL